VDAVLLVIFGAGASYDSVRDLASYSLRPAQMPPLAAGLFGITDYTRAALSTYRDALPVVQRMRDLLPEGGDVEVELRKLLDEADTYPDRHRHMMGVRHYLKAVITQAQETVLSATAGGTNYVTFVDVLRQWQAKSGEDVACVTFNYDTLLETALASSFGTEYETPADYLNNPWQVFKPHGSVGWVQLFNAKSESYGLPVHLDAIAHAALIEPTLNFAAAGGSVTWYPQEVWAPALAIPVAEKSEFACPPAHLEALGTLMPEVTRLIIVGWRAREAHFRDWIGELVPGHLSTLVVAEKPEAVRDTARNLPSAVVRNAVGFHNGGFSGLVRSPNLPRFLDRGL
jgi:hypothetical protein